MKSKMIPMVVASVFLSLTSAFASAETDPNRCPDLSGNYVCHGDTPSEDLYFNVTRTGGSTEDETIYLLDYPELDLHIEVKASKFGRKNQDEPTGPVYFAYCMRNAMLYILENDDSGFIQENFLKKGGYSVSVRGKSLGPPCERLNPNRAHSSRNLQPSHRSFSAAARASVYPLVKNSWKAFPPARRR